jgi:plastocyanin
MQRMRSGVLALALAGSIGLLAACGDSGSASSSSMASMPMPSASEAGTAAAAPVAGNAVVIKGFAFAPAALTVSVGTTVTWTNQDSDAHTVTSDASGGPLNSKAMGTGDTFSYTFTRTGTFKYLCTIHPFMTATVTVTR